ncbi:Bcrad16 [Botrytis cinerea B05.10]|uniref:Bcrad16 n=1 Tax=Botryotinia fuckeliana (strain B05.10) TaxID=332648 RepID=A0A384JLM7_BOTFB|nr:Bcrad16 [Botrytis cinerea B05.10]ATZ51277.1 Bcrad16 [Botrytis cinerea B05.10]
MAPTGKGRGRGRPRKAADSGNTGSVRSSRTSSRLSGVKQQDSNLELDELSSPAPQPETDSRNSMVIADSDDDGSLSDLPSPSLIGEYLSATKTQQKGKGKPVDSRQSLSTVSTSNDYNDGSDYSTPETSGVATPASTKAPVQPSNTASSTRRGRSQTINPVQSTSSLKAIDRARALQNSMYSLNPKKRKYADSEDDEIDDDNTPDAQLARHLQEQEYKKSSAPVVAESSTSLRRTPRNVQPINLAFDADFSEDDDDDEFVNPRVSRVSKKAKVEPKVELSRTSNAVSFRTPNRGKSTRYNDSNDDDEFMVIDSDSDVPMNLSSASRSSIKKESSRFSKAIHKHSESFQNSLKSSSTRKNTIKQQIQPPIPQLKTEDTIESDASSTLTDLPSPISDSESFDTDDDSMVGTDTSDDDGPIAAGIQPAASRGFDARHARHLINSLEDRSTRRSRKERQRLELQHPELLTMWKDLEDLPKIGDCKIEQPTNINRELKPFQLQGVGWMRAMEKTAWGGGLLGDEMGMGKTIQAVSLIMSDFPAKQPSLVLIPPVALMQWQQEIADYTDGTLKTFVFHGSNTKSKGITVQQLKKYDVILMSYNSLESMYRKQEKGFKRKDGIFKEKSPIHEIMFHRVILDEAHSIKQRTSGSAKACFALKANHKWCLSGTPLQNRIGEFFSLVRFLDIRPFACYFCKQCPCSTLEWNMNSANRCTGCNHSGMQHVSVFNQELLNPIQKFGNNGPGKEAFRKLRILTDRFMLRRVKRDHSSAMELPAKEIYVDRQFFGEEENDFAGSIMNNGARKFETYVAQGVLLNNYANIFGLIMQMRQVADHPDLILKKNGEGGQNILVCCICDETAEEAIKSACRHDFCRECAKNYLRSSESPDCPQCHIPLAIDLEQPEIEQDEVQVKKSSIINRIKMENWTSSSKIEALVHDLYQLRSKNSSSKSIIFSQFTTMLQLVEWRLRRAGITTVMLDGSMTPAQRQASINHFMTDVNVECFLVSLKAGGVALNLTEANKVFIVDPWWNPAAEWQSADRCHRIGQARPCSITRLCIEDSVESRMVLLQEKKANMIHSTINADESAMENLTPEDMQFLFRGT